MRIEFKFNCGSHVIFEETFGTWVCERTLQLTEFITVYTKLAEMAVLTSKDLTTEKKLPSVGLNLMQEIITGLGPNA